MPSADSLVPEDKAGMALLVYRCRDDYKSFAVQLREFRAQIQFIISRWGLGISLPRNGLN